MTTKRDIESYRLLRTMKSGLKRVRTPAGIWVSRWPGAAYLLLDGALVVILGLNSLRLSWY